MQQAIAPPVMILAAGLGKRMYPLTKTLPKPLLPVAGIPMIAHIIQALQDEGVTRLAVNLHHHYDLFYRWLRQEMPDILCSNERELLLDSGGGIKHALAIDNFADDIIVSLNADSLWRNVQPVQQLQALWQPDIMDALLLLYPLASAQQAGFDGKTGDYHVTKTGQLTRPEDLEKRDYVFTGIQIIKTSFLRQFPKAVFSLREIWHPMREAGRLYGAPLAGEWYHAGTLNGLYGADKVFSL